MEPLRPGTLGPDGRPLRFATAITCMDGRIQQAVVDVTRTWFGVDYVDMVTVPGPDRVLTQDFAGRLRLATDVAVSTRAHGSHQLVVASHADCAGNPVPDAEHEQLVAEGVAWLADQFPGVTIVGIHLDGKGRVRRVAGRAAGPAEHLVERGAGRVAATAGRSEG